MRNIAPPIVRLAPDTPQRRIRNYSGVNNPLSPYDSCTRIRVTRWQEETRLLVTGYRVMLRGQPFSEPFTIESLGSANAAFAAASRLCYSLNHNPESSMNGKHYVIPLTNPTFERNN